MTASLYAEWGKKKLGSVGRPVPGAQLRVIDPETGAILPAGQEGLLEVVSPQMGPDWIRTTDLGVIDEDGFVFHRARADGAIMRGGFKVLPETIERALLLHAAISAVSVVGVADRRLGQTPAAALQLKPGSAPPSIGELEAHSAPARARDPHSRALALRRRSAQECLDEDRSPGRARAVRDVAARRGFARRSAAWLGADR